MSDDTEYDFHSKKKSGKTYVSRRLDGGLRIASKVIDTDGLIHEIALKDELVLRRTPSGRQEIVAKFYEGARKLNVVTIQRWNTLKGTPQEKVYFSFVGSEIELIRTFLSKIVDLHFPDSGKVNVQDSDLRTVVTTADQARAILGGNLNLVIQLAENEVTERDLVALGYRRKQLVLFEKMLSDPAFFAEQVEHATDRRPEAVWQAFFEANRWVFGYGLSYIHMDSLDGRKLEQTVRGFSIFGAGKRADALMKTRAEVSSLCFVEIKRHDTNLLATKEYRPGVWSASPELVGGIGQAQETVRTAIRTLSAPFRPSDERGNPTGEEIFGFEPRSYLVIGDLTEFAREHGTNEEKFRSFEAFRRNVRQPEIITYDELLHRARFIVSNEVVETKSKSPVR